MPTPDPAQGQDAASSADPAGQPAARDAEPGSRRVEQLFRDHNEALLRFLRARLHSPQEAKDVAQEAYVQLLGLRNTRAIGFLQAYLFRTAANLATNRIQQQARRRQLDELVFFDIEPTRSPEFASAAEQELALVERALRELPEPCRSAFELVSLHELSIDEAAKRLGLHPRRVRRFVARALEHCHLVVHGADPTKKGSRA